MASYVLPVLFFLGFVVFLRGLAGVILDICEAVDDVRLDEHLRIIDRIQATQRAALHDLLDTAYDAELDRNGHRDRAQVIASLRRVTK